MSVGKHFTASMTRPISHNRRKITAIALARRQEPKPTSRATTHARGRTSETIPVEQGSFPPKTPGPFAKLRTCNGRRFDRLGVVCVIGKQGFSRSGPEPGRVSRRLHAGRPFGRQSGQAIL